VPSATRWLESLSPWPSDGFGLERMRELLARIGNPERELDTIHVVGTKGKSTAARRLAATIGGRAYTSPHVSGWHERLQTDTDGFERAIERVRPDAEELGATQFEILTAAAFADFAASGLKVGAIEAGLGGRLDATNVIDARVVLLTNVGLDHTEVLGDTREAIAREKLAVAAPGAVVVLPDEEFAHLLTDNDVRVGGAREAAAAFLGRDVDLADASLPGRFEVRDREIWDGAHTPEAVDWLLERLPEPGSYVVVASILRDKDAGAILERLARAGSTFVATESSNDRALTATELAELAAPHFERVESVAEPHAARARALELAGHDGRVLVTGSLYLLADLYKMDSASRMLG
jgi:dihydrofolate synthase/folylpolyglutamate synthase